MSWKDRTHWVCARCNGGWCTAQGTDPPGRACAACGTPLLQFVCDHPDYYDPPVVALEADVPPPGGWRVV